MSLRRRSEQALGAFQGSLTWTVGCEEPSTQQRFDGGCSFALPAESR